MENIVVYGKGQFFEKRKEVIEEKYEIIAYLDSKCYIDKQINNVPILHPREVVRYKTSKVIIMSGHYISMVKELINNGVDEERILFGVNYPPYCEKSYFYNENTNLSYRNGLYYYRDDIGTEYQFRDDKELSVLMKEVYRKHNDYSEFVKMLPEEPISRKFGMERGKPIDRYYIEEFLEANKQYICGDVMEIADNSYTLEFGGVNVNNSLILHVEGGDSPNIIKGNLETGEGISANMVDCIIFTQTIQFIYNIDKVAKNIIKLLRPNGCALITAASITQISRYDMDRWGDYWRFTELSMKKLFENIMHQGKVEVVKYGNVKTAVSFLYGLSCEDLREETLNYKDDDYPLVIAAVVQKSGKVREKWGK